MLCRTSCVAIAVALASVSLSQGQVVQLPTLRSFSVDTTVVVPDRGSAFLGGVSRASYGSNSYGVPGFSKLPGLGRLFTNRSSGSSVSSSNASVSATIIDLHEMDEAVLAAAARQRALAATDVARRHRAAFLAQHIGRTNATQFVRSQPTVGGPPDRRTSKRRTEVTALDVFATAQRAEAAGRLGAARCGYRRVERMAHGELQTRAQARLAALEPPPPVSLAVTSPER